MRRVTVGVDPPYDVVIGDGALQELETLVGGYRRAVVVSQTRVAEATPEALRDEGALGVDPWIVTMGDGEVAKSLGTVGALCSDFARGGLLRGDLVIALGGGVVGDTAGFAAAVYHRGVALVQVPTTLLAQVDAAIGGKTAVNLAEGKNLVGAFHQPVAVVADTALLATLPTSEFRNGLGEVAKYALLPQGGAVVDLLRMHTDAVLARDPAILAELVAACVAIKAAFVAEDPYEQTGVRAILNYGHTLAHALETTGAYALAHGEAVAIGLVFAVNLAAALERVGLDAVDRVHGVVSALGLPVRVPSDADRAELLTIMQRDKKARGGLTFVLPGAGGIEIVHDPPASALDRAFASVGA
ncbi:MAG TPA: 3-dehydroquinate synthase [Acidimicrobiia bacterium]|jgi:3-dehydroquinate synthase